MLNIVYNFEIFWFTEFEHFVRIGILTILGKGCALRAFYSKTQLQEIGLRFLDFQHCMRFLGKNVRYALFTKNSITHK